MGASRKVWGMRAVVALMAAIAGCGGSSKGTAAAKNEIEFEEDDSSARPACWPNCVTGKWADADVRVALLEVSKCSGAAPLLVSEHLRGHVTVTVQNATCEQAVADVAGAAGFEARTLRVYSFSDAGKPIVIDALIVRRRDDRRGRLVAAADFKSGHVENPEGIIEGGPDPSAYSDCDDCDYDNSGAGSGSAYRAPREITPEEALAEWRRSRAAAPATANYDRGKGSEIGGTDKASGSPKSGDEPLPDVYKPHKGGGWGDSGGAGGGDSGSAPRPGPSPSVPQVTWYYYGSR